MSKNEPFNYTFACFDCRRTARAPHGATRKCPECRGEMIEMPLDFETPPRKDKKAWEAERRQRLRGS